MSVGDLLEPGAQLGIVLMRVAASLRGCALAFAAQLVGHPKVEPVDEPTISGESVVPLALADEDRELLERASSRLGEPGGDAMLLGVRVLREVGEVVPQRRLRLEVLVGGGLGAKRREQLVRRHRRSLLQQHVDGTVGRHARLQPGHRLRQRQAGIERRLRE
jgi:hypothetical protein